MHFVRGEKKVRETIKKQLDSEKEKFTKTAKKREAKFLFVILESLNYLVGGKLLVEQDGWIDRIDIPTYQLILSLRAMLDIILRRRVSAVQMVSKEEFLEILLILKEHLRIGVLSHMLYIQDTSPVREIKIEDDVIAELQDEDSIAFYQALESWVTVAGVDSNWINWYFGRFQEKRAKVGILLRKGFKKIYGLELLNLKNISEYFRGVSEDHLKTMKWSVESIPFLYVKRKTLQRDFSKYMDRSDTREWFGLLEYRPGRDLLKAPLIPVNVRGVKAYTLMTWVFTPSNHFWAAWITDLLLENPKLSARGKWADQYGRAFQSYLDEKLVESKLPITNLGSRKISVLNYPDIQPWLSKLQRKAGFEVDRLIRCYDTVYVVSCKARDFLYDRKVTRRDLFFPKKELERRVKQNLKDMTEIRIEASCIESCLEMRKAFQLMGVRITPILLTSMREPLSIPEVRSYYSKRRGVKFPEVHILTIQQFIELIKHQLSIGKP